MAVKCFLIHMQITLKRFAFVEKKVMLNCNENYVTMDGGDSVCNGDVSYRFTHDVKAGLSLRWANMVFIDAFMFHFNEPRLEKTAQLVSYTVQFPSFRNLIFHASRRLLRGFLNTIFDGPDRKHWHSVKDVQ